MKQTVLILAFRKNSSTFRIFLFTYSIYKNNSFNQYYICILICWIYCIFIYLFKYIGYYTAFEKYTFAVIIALSNLGFRFILGLFYFILLNINSYYKRLKKGIKNYIKNYLQFVVVFSRAYAPSKYALEEIINSMFLPLMKKYLIRSKTSLSLAIIRFFAPPPLLVCYAKGAEYFFGGG